MTSETVVSKNRTDVTIEFDGLIIRVKITHLHAREHYQPNRHTYEQSSSVRNHVSTVGAMPLARLLLELRQQCRM
jgi:hypothetical protein